MLVRAPDTTTLDQVFWLRYGPPDKLGWAPTLRRRFGYHQPDEHYEALLAGLVLPNTRWLDVGCGRDLFPFNQPLAKLLSQRAARLVGVDPDVTLDENPFVHEKVRAAIDDYDGQHGFDLVTLRMVAEHIEQPERCLQAVERALAPGGVAVVYTVNGHSPVPLLTRCLPMSTRHRIKAFLWRTQAKDTFPTHFRMNTRKRLQKLFAGVGMHEKLFLRVDDCRTLSRFRVLHELELRVRDVCKSVRLPYPEQCLLAVYEKP